MRVFKNGKYFVADIWIAGKKRRISTGLDNRAAAQKAAEAEQARLKSQGKAEDNFGSSLALEAVVIRYMKAVGCEHKAKANTALRLDKLVEFFGANKLITEITHDEVVELRHWRRKDTVGGTGRKITNSTVNSTVEQLKKLYTFLKNRGVHFQKPPVWRDLWLKEPQEHVRELSDEEAARFDAALAEARPDYIPVFEFARTTGKRRANVVGLKWSEVKWDRGIIETTGKDGALIRLTITPAIRAILEPLKGHHKTQVFTFVAQNNTDKVIRGHHHLFVKGQRYPMTADSLRGTFDLVRKKAGLTAENGARFRFHDFRHDFATKLLRAERNPKLLQKALDHSPNSTTWTRYAHVLDEEVSDAMERLAESRKNHSKNHSRAKLKVV